MRLSYFCVYSSQIHCFLVHLLPLYLVNSVYYKDSKQMFICFASFSPRTPKFQFNKEKVFCYIAGDSNLFRHRSFLFDKMAYNCEINIISCIKIYHISIMRFDFSLPLSIGVGGTSRGQNAP